MNFQSSVKVKWKERNQKGLFSSFCATGSSTSANLLQRLVSLEFWCVSSTHWLRRSTRRHRCWKLQLSKHFLPLNKNFLDSLKEGWGAGGAAIIFNSDSTFCHLYSHRDDGFEMGFRVCIQVCLWGSNFQISRYPINSVFWRVADSHTLSPAYKL